MTLTTERWQQAVAATVTPFGLDWLERKIIHKEQMTPELAEVIRLRRHVLEQDWIEYGRRLR